MLLDLIYAADQEKEVDVELLEGLTSLVVQYFKYNPKVVAEIWRNKRQLMRERLPYAYTMFIDSFSAEDLNKYKRENEDFRQVSFLMEESQHGGQ